MNCVKVQQNIKIKLENLSRSFNNKPVISNLNLEIRKGEFLVLLGRSGSGKSVLMKLMLGLLVPDEGRIVIDNQDIWKLSKKRRLMIAENLGVVFQGGALFNDMTVRENLKAALSDQTEQPEKLIEDIAESCNFDLDLIDGLPHELSGGLKQRAAAARALIREPDLLFFDEPTSGLDPMNSETISNFIRQCHEKKNTTSVMITHDMRSAAIAADRILYLDRRKRTCIELINEAELAKLRSGDDPVKKVEESIREKIELKTSEKGEKIQPAGRHEKSAVKLLTEQTASVFSTIGHLFTSLGRLRLSSPPEKTLSCLSNVIIQSLPLIITSGFLIGLALILSTIVGLAEYGAEHEASKILGATLVREVGPILAALLLAGRIGASIASDIGLRTTGKDFDAWRTMGKDPDELFYTPLFISIIIGFPILLIVVDAAGYFGGLAGYAGIYGYSAVGFKAGFFELINWNDVLCTFIKGLIFGHIILSIAYQAGMDVLPPARTIGKQVTHAVVAASLVVIAANFFIMRIYYLLTS